MELKLNDSLEIATPYMLRNDGKLFTCGEFHPYFKYLIFETDESQIKDLFEEEFHQIKWFYDYTNSNKVKSMICEFLKGIILNRPYYEIPTKISNIIFSTFPIDGDISNISIDDTNKIFNLINTETNNEFCRMRMSALRFGGNSKSVYFRISDNDTSHTDKWIKLIKQTVQQHQNDISDVTVVNDPQSLGGQLLFYNLNGILLQNVDTKTFINL